MIIFTADSLPTSDIDPFEAGNLEDPSMLHEEVRELSDVVYLSRHDIYAIARYDDVHRALTDWQALQSGAGVGLSNFAHEKPWRPPSLLLEADPPRHDAPRAVLEKILSPRRLQSMEAAWRQDAADLVDAIVSHEREFDGVHAIAEQFPLRVFPDAVGIEADHREYLLPYGDFAFNAFGPRNDRVAMSGQGIGAVIEWISAQCQRENLAEEGFGAQIWASADRGEILPAQAPLIVRSLLTAGVDTTVSSIASVLYAFATHPEEWDRLRADRSLHARAFEEAVRWESPVQTFFRTTTTDTLIGATVIPAGRKVLMFLGAANRDPRRWTDPTRFDLTRDPSGHVGFGMGIHQCVGQHVARLEARCVLDALLDRVTRIEITTAPRRHLNNTLRGWESMPLRVTLS